MDNILKKGIEIEKDCALRGLWIHGLKEINDYVHKHTYCMDDAIFIPDKVVKMLRDFRAVWEKNDLR